MSNRSQLAYDHIRRKLARERIDPQRGLSEPGLARELNISRTPVREAIRRLQSEGILEQRPKRGTFVRQLDLSDLDEIYQVRLLLEPFAAAEAARRISPSSLRELARLTREMLRISRACKTASSRETCERLWAEHRDVDIGFHEVLLRAAENQRILKIVDDARILMLAMSFPETTLEGAGPLLTASYREHARIMHAVRDGDAPLARKRMHAHLADGWNAVIEFMSAWRKRQAAGVPEPAPLLPAPW